MPNKIIVNDKGVVTVRIDGVYTVNEKHFVLPLNDRFFGSFKFTNPKEAKQTLKDAVKLSKLQDSIFEGQYPKWVEDNYGTSLKVNGKVKFFKGADTTEEVPDLEIRNFNYSIEIHLLPTKDKAIYMRVARAIVLGEAQSRYNNDLYKDDIKTPVTDDASVDVDDDNLPF